MKRIGSKGYARARAAEAAGEPPPSDREDDDEDDDEGPPSSEDAMTTHEPLRADAEAKFSAAAEAYRASKGTDSAAALMAADDAGDAAIDAHTAAKASSAKMRGAAVEEAPPPSTQRGAGAPPPTGPAPPSAQQAAVPVASLARAIAATGGTIEAQTKAIACIGFADRMLALFSAANIEEAEGRARAAHQDAADAAGLRAAAEKAKIKSAARAKVDADAALRAELSAAVRAGKYSRAELFAVSEGTRDGKPVEVLTPLAWVRDMAPSARVAMIAKKQARGPSERMPSSLTPDETPTAISAAVKQYGASRGWPEGDPRYAAMAAALPTTAATTAAPETA